MRLPLPKQVLLVCQLFAKIRIKRKIAQTKSKDIVAFIPKDSALKFVSIVLRYNVCIDRCPSGRRSTPGTRVRCKPSGVRIPFCLPFPVFSHSSCAPASLATLALSHIIHVLYTRASSRRCNRSQRASTSFCHCSMMCSFSFVKRCLNRPCTAR